MANEIRWRHDVSGATLYALVWATDGTVRDVVHTAWDSFLVADLADYALTLSESPSGSYRFAATVPSGLTADRWYTLELYEQVGATPAIGDLLVSRLVRYWNGTIFTPQPDYANSQTATAVALAGLNTSNGLVLAEFAAIYTAEIDYRIDEANEVDEYRVTWMKNGVPCAYADVTLPTIAVDLDSGTALLASTAMDWDDAHKMLMYDAADAERNSAGRVLRITTTATIDGSTRTFTALRSRDL
jgi:hypothetical protein